MDKDKQHILVVDDDTRLRNLLERFLREQGFMVSGAKNADDAVQMLNQYKFDLLVVDVMMPGISGIEFLKNLRYIFLNSFLLNNTFHLQIKAFVLIFFHY